MRKYTLVKLLENKQKGYQFSWATWPMHLTLVDDFFIDLDKPELYKMLKELLAGQRPVKTVAQNDDLMGPSKDTPVTIIKTTPGLMSLHNKLIGLLEKSGAVLVSPEFAEDGFRPHATIQGKHRLHTGDKVIVDAVSIIDMQPSGDVARRKLLSTINLPL
jgi:hypothetical protein